MRAKTWIMVATVVLLATGCSTTKPLSGAEQASLAAPPPAIAARVAALQPAAVAFVKDSDREILGRGRALTTDEMALASEVGVSHPELVRVLVIDPFIAPRDPAFAIEAGKLGIGASSEGGRTTGYGIQIKPAYAKARWILAHELTHVGQFERLGTTGYVHEYLTELLLVGYARAPLEREAHANERLGK